MHIAIIPARSGSKRVKNKNIKNFKGTPIIGRVIHKLKESELFDRIIVSTDSEEIAQIARAFGAEVPFMRPKSLADDFTSTADVVIHAIESIDLPFSENDLICCVYPTSVLLQSQDLSKSLELIQNDQWQYVFAASQPSASPLRSFKKSSTGGVEMLFPQFWESRSQDLPACFVDTGLFYWATPNTWTKANPIFNSKSTFVVIPEDRAIDINTESDWLRAEYVFEQISNQSSE